MEIFKQRHELRMQRAKDQFEAEAEMLFTFKKVQSPLKQVI